MIYAPQPYNNPAGIAFLIGENAARLRMGGPQLVAFGGRYYTFRQLEALAQRAERAESAQHESEEDEAWHAAVAQ